MLLRFHYTELMKHVSEFFLEAFVKKEIAAVQFLVKQGLSIKDACRMAGMTDPRLADLKKYGKSNYMDSSRCIKLCKQN